jgi:hypothetical protein
LLDEIFEVFFDIGVKRRKFDGRFGSGHPQFQSGWKHQRDFFRRGFE